MANVAVSESNRRLFTQLNKDKSNEELRRHISLMANQILATPINSSQATITQAQILLEEMTVCSDILAERKQEGERLAAAHKKWDDTILARRYAAVRNLKEAVTPNGQLVAAILEEEGSLSETDLSIWCEELESLDTNVMHNLLISLVDEGVISYENGQYTLKQICTESLLPEDIAGWLDKRFLCSHAEEDEVILRLMQLRGTAICPEDYPQILEGKILASVAHYLDIPEERCKEIISEGRFNYKLEAWYKDGLLNKTKIDGFDMYYFRMMGETR